MRYLVTVGYWLVFLLTAPLEFALVVLTWAVTAPFDPTRRAVHALLCHWTFQYLRVMPGWKVEVRGRELLPCGPAVFVANHQSMADVLAAMGLRTPFKFVSKASLFRLPVMGWAMRMARYVGLERGNRRSTQEMMDACRGWLRRGVPVLLFPEGTYSEGKGMLPFKRGAFVLAIEEKVPVVPVVLEGTRTLIDGDGPWMSPRARIQVTVLPPIPPEALGEDEAALSDRVRAQLTAALESR